MAKLKVVAHYGKLMGTVMVPTSKYHLHRALIMGSLAEGETIIHGKSQAVHIKDTLRSLKDLGVTVRSQKKGYIVEGGVYKPRNGKIRVGSSGSTLQFLLGLGSLSQGIAPVFDGHNALRQRPISPLLHALRDMGVQWKSYNFRMPVTVQPKGPTGGHIQIQGTLSQWISGLLMLAPFAEKDTIIEVLPPFNERNYVQLTIQMMRHFGIQIEENVDGTQWRIPARQKYYPTTVSLEPDLSSAAFPLVLAALHPADILLKGISGQGSHPEGYILELLRNAGVPLLYDYANQTIRIHHKGLRPKAIEEIDMRNIPDLIPALSVLAALSKGRTVLKNIGPGRLKESNRVKAMMQLNRMGAKIQEEGDALIIDGVDRLVGAPISTYNDHRVEMAFILAATRAEGVTELTYPHAYLISYPEFMDHLAMFGVQTWVSHSASSRITKELVMV